MTEQEIMRRFPNASASFTRLNATPAAIPIKEAKPQMEVESAWQKYLEFGSVHRVGEFYGVCGDTVRRVFEMAGKRLSGSRWRAEEINTLKAAYSKAEGFNLADVAAALNRTHAAVACKANDLGLCGNRGEQKRTDEARENYSKAQKERFERMGSENFLTKAASEAAKIHGHPRGMLGKTHTEEVRQRISDANTGTIRPRQAVEQMLKTKLERHGTLAPNVKRGSWKAGWREVGGQKFYARSKWEANYARHLEFLKSAGEITAWEHEPETFWFEGYKRGTMSYLPDFKVTLGDRVEYHEVKGWMDARSKTKLNRMAKHYPKIVLRVIDGPRYKALCKTIRSLVPDWEP